MKLSVYCTSKGSDFVPCSLPIDYYEGGGVVGITPGGHVSSNIITSEDFCFLGDINYADSIFLIIPRILAENIRIERYGISFDLLKDTPTPMESGDVILALSHQFEIRISEEECISKPSVSVESQFSNKESSIYDAKEASMDDLLQDILQLLDPLPQTQTSPFDSSVDDILQLLQLLDPPPETQASPFDSSEKKLTLEEDCINQSSISVEPGFANKESSLEDTEELSVDDISQRLLVLDPPPETQASPFDSSEKKLTLKVIKIYDQVIHEGPSQTFDEWGGGIGRETGLASVKNFLTLPDNEDKLVSRRHGEILFINNEYHYSDISINGSRVVKPGSREPIILRQDNRKIQLQHGDLIVVGKFTLQALIENNLPPKAAPTAFEPVLESCIRGIYRLVQVRLRIKEGMHADSTQVQQAVTANPFRFARTEQECLDHVTGKMGTMTEQHLCRVIEDSITDIIDHEAAIFYGMKVGVKTAIDVFDPHKIEEECRKNQFIQRKSICWDWLVERYPGLCSDIQDVIFTQAFSTAYQEKLRQLRLK